MIFVHVACCLWRFLAIRPRKAMRGLSMHPVSRHSFCTNTIFMLLSSAFFPERQGGSALTPSSSGASSSSSSSTAMGLSLSVSDGVQVLWQYCPDEFMRAVQDSKRFLYRGEASDITAPVILNPKPDLLVPGTYDDPSALHYFEWMERELTDLAKHSADLNSSSIGSSKRPGKSNREMVRTAPEIVRPSRGHVATSDERVAANWGTPVSVWPLGGSFSYVWPRNRPLLFPGGGETLDDLVVHKDLDIALSAGREVLFSTSSAAGSDLDLHGPAYMAFPKSLEPELRERLRAIRYGLTR